MAVVSPPLSATAVAPAAVPAGAVSWAAIIAGAVATSALSLILLILGTGLGLTSLSPYGARGMSAMALGVSAIVWLMVTQALASGMGGYIAGRLRMRWQAVPTDEVYFRDTAHGFLSWCVATLLTAGLLASAIGTVVGGAAQAGASVAAGASAAAGGAAAAAAGQAEPGEGPMAYFVDSMFRRPAGPEPLDQPRAEGEAPAGEALRILARSRDDGTLDAEDQRYLGQLVAERTGLPQAEAEQRVSATVARMQEQRRQLEAQARDAAEKARKAGIHATLWLFVSLLLGAFSASLAATWGGRERDA